MKTQTSKTQASRKSSQARIFARGKELFESGAVKVGKESFEVNGYSVTTEECTCPYFQTHKEKCKHMVAVELWIQEQERKKKEKEKEETERAVRWIASASVETLLKLTPQKQCKAMKLLAAKILELEEELKEQTAYRELEKLVP